TATPRKYDYVPAPADGSTDPTTIPSDGATVTTNVYDALGRRTKSTAAANATKVSKNTPFGASYSYPELAGYAPPVTEWTYDAVAKSNVPHLGAATQQTEAPFLQTRRTGYEYDRLGRKTTVTEAWAPAWMISGDTSGRTYQDAVRDNLGHASPVTKYEYDAFG